MTIDQAFNDSVSYYDDWMKKALPNYDELFGTAKNLPVFDSNSAIDVLDLGAGTGLFSMHILHKYPQANFVLCDVAEKLLGIAKLRFANQAAQFQYLVQDYRSLNGNEQYDLIISSLSIHHLEHDEKAQLFKNVYHLLKKNGVFINVDQIQGETTYIRDYYWNHWLERVRATGCEEDRIQESIHRRVTYDHDATLVDQLTWLKDSGFSHVDCVYKNHFVGVFWAVKA